MTVKSYCLSIRSFPKCEAHIGLFPSGVKSKNQNINVVGGFIQMLMDGLLVEHSRWILFRT